MKETTINNVYLADSDVKKNLHRGYYLRSKLYSLNVNILILQTNQTYDSQLT